MDVERLKEQLTRQEGEVDHVYKDSLGYETIGVGHLVDDRLSGGLDEEVIQLQLELDIKRAYEEAKTYPWFDGLNDARENVIVNIIFNMGKARFDKFVNTQLAISKGDIEGAAQGLEKSLWYRQVGRRGVELVKQWRTGTWV